MAGSWNESILVDFLIGSICADFFVGDYFRSIGSIRVDSVQRFSHGLDAFFVLSHF